MPPSFQSAVLMIYSVYCRFITGIIGGFLVLIVVLMMGDVINADILPKNALKVRPTIAGTWDFSQLGINQAIPLLQSGKSALDSVEEAIRTIELDTQDQYFVGVGGYPNSLGVMELDAAIMDHECNYGAVMSIPNISTPISVARTVMERCAHNILTGQGAMQWAQANGFAPTHILTENVKKEWEEWISTRNSDREDCHDTIGIVCIDEEGRLAAGTSTSGWKFKHPGRVGDSPVIGSGLYCDGHIGAAVATGDGEEIMRSCACYLVVELLRSGVDIQKACQIAVQRIAALPRKGKDLDTMHEKLVVGIVAIDRQGRVGAASTLGERNLHRGRPFFPVPVWRGKGEGGEEEQIVLQASEEGASG